MPGRSYAASLVEGCSPDLDDARRAAVAITTHRRYVDITRRPRLHVELLAVLGREDGHGIKRHGRHRRKQAARRAASASSSARRCVLAGLAARAVLCVSADLGEASANLLEILIGLVRLELDLPARDLPQVRPCVRATREDPVHRVGAPVCASGPRVWACVRARWCCWMGVVRRQQRLRAAARASPPPAPGRCEPARYERALLDRPYRDEIVLASEMRRRPSSTSSSTARQSTNGGVRHSAARSNSEMMPSKGRSRPPSALNERRDRSAAALTCQGRQATAAPRVTPASSCSAEELLMRDRRPPTADALPLAFGLHAAVASPFSFCRRGVVGRWSAVTKERRRRGTSVDVTAAPQRLLAARCGGGDDDEASRDESRRCCGGFQRRTHGRRERLCISGIPPPCPRLPGRTVRACGSWHTISSRNVNFSPHRSAPYRHPDRGGRRCRRRSA